MECRGVLLLGALVGAAVAAFATACDAPNPGELIFSERPPSGAADSVDSGGSVGDGGRSTSDAGGSIVPDSGGAAADPIFGTSTLAWQDPGLTANNGNAKHEGKVESKDCIVAGCHLDGNKPWSFAGTLYVSVGGATATKGEVRIVKPDGTELAHAYTDANGNFWFPPGTTIPAGSRVGARREGGTRTMMMTQQLQPTDRGCNAARANCHGTATGNVIAP